MYDPNDRFLRLYCCGGHCDVRGVFTLSLLACLLYNWKNQFLRLLLNGGQSILWLVLHCFSSMFVDVRLGKSISQVAVEWRSVSFAAICSLFCSMLVPVRLKELIFRIDVRVEILFLEVKL